MHRRYSIAAAALTLMGLTATTAQAANAPAAGAADKAADYVKTRPSKLHVSASDTFHQQQVISSKDGLQYVPYERSYKGLPVLGGDFVVVTKPDGQVASTAVAQDETINVATTPTVTEAQAEQTATSKLAGTVDGVESTDLVVDATEDTPRLAYETVVTGHRGEIPSRLHVVTDATTGAVLSTQDEVVDGNGTGWINGPNPLAINTSGSGASFNMTDSTRPGISCRNYTSKAVLTGTDDNWGNGNGTNIETGCADALFSVQREWDMLKNWYGRAASTAPAAASRSTSASTTTTRSGTARASRSATTRPASGSPRWTSSATSSATRSTPTPPAGSPPTASPRRPVTSSAR